MLATMIFGMALLCNRYTSYAYLLPNLLYLISIFIISNAYIYNRSVLGDFDEYKSNIFCCDGFGDDAVWIGNNPPVATQSNPFEGAYGQIGVGYETTKISGAGGRDGGIPYTVVNQSNDKGLAGTITAGYNFAVRESFVLGVGVEYSPLHGHKGQLTSGESRTLSNYSKNSMYNLFLSPGYVINKDGLAYAKVGYSKINENLSPPGRRIQATI